MLQDRPVSSLKSQVASLAWSWGKSTTLQRHALPRGPIVVLFGFIYRITESYKVSFLGFIYIYIYIIPKRNYYGPSGQPKPAKASTLTENPWFREDVRPRPATPGMHQVGVSEN